MFKIFKQFCGFVFNLSKHHYCFINLESWLMTVMKNPYSQTQPWHQDIPSIGFPCNSCDAKDSMMHYKYKSTSQCRLAVAAGCGLYLQKLLQDIWKHVLVRVAEEINCLTKNHMKNNFLLAYHYFLSLCYCLLS